MGVSLYHFDACNFSSITLQPAGCQVLERAGPTSPHSADPLTLKGLPLPPTLGQLPFLTVRSSPWPSCLCLAPLHAPDLQVCAPPYTSCSASDPLPRSPVLQSRPRPRSQMEPLRSWAHQQADPLWPLLGRTPAPAATTATTTTCLSSQKSSTAYSSMPPVFSEPRARFCFTVSLISHFVSDHIDHPGLPGRKTPGSQDLPPPTRMQSVSKRSGFQRPLRGLVSLQV